MNTDPLLSPASFTEYLISFAGVFLFILIPGKALIRLLKIDNESLLGRIVFATILGYLCLHFLAYAVFITRSDIPWYFYASTCLVCLLWFSYQSFEGRFWKNYRTWWEDFVQLLKSPYAWTYAFLVLFILFDQRDMPWQRVLVKKGTDDTYVLEAVWDSLLFVTSAIGQIQSFFPVENPHIPGEPPLYFSWLGSILPVFFVKYLGLDLTHSYYALSFPYIHIAFILLIHYLVSQFSTNRWTPLFAVGLFFLTPNLSLDVVRHDMHRNLAGKLFIVACMIFIHKYISTQKKTFIPLAFLCWTILYAVKGDHLIATFFMAALFFFRMLFPGTFPKIDVKALLLWGFCAVLFSFQLWVGYYFFSAVFSANQATYFILSPHGLAEAKDRMLPIMPLILVYSIYYFQKLYKRREPFSHLELVSWVTLLWVFLILTFATKPLRSDLNQIILFSLVTALPIVLQRWIFNRRVYISLGISFLVLFAFMDYFQARSREVAPVTRDELSVYRFIRENTPEDSVILHNFYRYNDQPAVMNALTYRRTFINEGERHVSMINLRLEQRLYDYWDFLSYEYSEEDLEYFFLKYPYINYVLEFDKSFIKSINPIVGMSSIVGSIPILNKDPALFQEVFRNNSARVYKINRKSPS